MPVESQFRPGRWPLASCCKACTDARRSWAGCTSLGRHPGTAVRGMCGRSRWACCPAETDDNFVDDGQSQLGGTAGQVLDGVIRRPAAYVPSMLG